MTTGLLVRQLTTPGGRRAGFVYRPGTSDWNTIQASVAQDEYGLPRDASGHAVDIGGYLGTVGISYALDNPAASVTIVEPVPGNADLIETNIEANGVGDRVTLIRGAAGRGGEAVEVWYGYQGNELAEHHAWVGNSSLAYDGAGMLPHESVTYAATPLADLVPCAWLKIDCEGGEWAILDSPAVAGIDVIVGEAHAVRGHRGRDIIDLLGATHDVTLVGGGEGTCEFRAVRR